MQCIADGFETMEQRVDLSFGWNDIDITLRATVVFDAAQVTDLYNSGVQAFQQRDFAPAIAAMAEVLNTIGGESTELADIQNTAMMVLGNSYSESGQLDEAIGAYEVLVDAAPQDIRGHIGLGQIYSRRQENVAAAEHFAAAGALAPENSALQYNTGIVYLVAGRKEDTVTAMERAIELNPGLVVAYKNVGYAYARFREYTKAVEWFEQYLELQPEAPDRADIERMLANLTK